MDWLFRSRNFYPLDYQKTVFDIDYRQLAASGVKMLLIDLDNTLIPYDQTAPNARIEALFAHLRELRLQVAIISNNHQTRVEPFARQLGVPFVASAKKPFRFGFRRAQALFPDIRPAEILVIGDQFMTDVLGANRMGFSVIVVDAIKREVEKWFTKINRRLEKRVLARMKKRDLPYYQRLGLDEKR